jgi:hypothetical protein
MLHKQNKPMKQQPDKLFREKLEQHTVPEPEAAWSRIEANLASKPAYGFWWKIAASVALLAVALAWLMPMGGTEKQQLADGHSKTTMPASPSEKRPTAGKSINTPLEKDRKENVQSGKKEKKNPGAPKKKSPPVMNFSKQGNTLAEVTTTITPIETGQQEGIAQATEPIQQSQVPSENTQEEVESTTVVFAATEVNSKYLPGEKTSSFRKLLDKAADLKKNQEAIGELRQRKNEILALNPDRYRDRNEKRERNN